MHPGLESFWELSDEAGSVSVAIFLHDGVACECLASILCLCAALLPERFVGSVEPRDISIGPAMQRHPRYAGVLVIKATCSSANPGGGNPSPDRLSVPPNGTVVCADLLRRAIQPSLRMWVRWKHNRNGEIVPGAAAVARVRRSLHIKNRAARLGECCGLRLSRRRTLYEVLLLVCMYNKALRRGADKVEWVARYECDGSSSGWS